MSGLSSGVTGLTPRFLGVLPRLLMEISQPVLHIL